MSADNQINELIAHKIDLLLTGHESLRSDMRALRSDHHQTREDMRALPLKMLELTEQRFARKESITLIHRVFASLLIALILSAAGYVSSNMKSARSDPAQTSRVYQIPQDKNQERNQHGP